MESYNQEVKKDARRKTLTHAVKLVTSRRQKADEFA